MKVFGSIFCFLSSLIFIRCRLTQIKDDSVILAMKNITKYLSEQNKSFLIMNYRSEFRMVNSSIEAIVGESLEFKNAKIKNIHVSRIGTFVYGDNSIATFGSFNIFEYANRQLFKYETFDLRDEQQFVYCKNMTREKLTESIANKKIQMKHFQYFLIESENQIELLTFVWFSPGQCNEPKLIEVNSFDKKMNQWKSSKFKIEKFTNYFGCEIVVYTHSEPDTFDYLMYSDYNKTQPINCLGVWYKSMKALSKSFNFTLKCGNEMNVSNELPIAKVIQYSFIKKAVEWRLDSSHMPHAVSFTVAVKPHHFEGVYFAIPPGEYFDGYEKFILPFDYYTWILIIFTFAASFATIFVVVFFAPSFKSFVFGEKINSPSLNVAAHFFGLGQNVLPKKSFARFILMTFIILSLIIRTAWQGKNFEFMSRNITKPQLQSIDEIINKNYSLFPHMAKWSLYTLIGKG
jgi:hypothetical protein